MKYTIDDLQKEGHVFITKDKKYALKKEGSGYAYWHRVACVNNGHVYLNDWPMGRYSYDYCFFSNLGASIGKLNEILERRSETDVSN